MEPDHWPVALRPTTATTTVNEPIRVLEGELGIQRERATSATYAAA